MTWWGDGVWWEVIIHHEKKSLYGLRSKIVLNFIEQKSPTAGAFF
jgi:hypothetical protein